MQFSSDGRYLSLGSDLGSISVWALGEHLHQNVAHILKSVHSVNDFWFNYPIYLPDFAGAEAAEINIEENAQEFVPLRAPSGIELAQHYLNEPMMDKFAPNYVPLRDGKNRSPRNNFQIPDTEMTHVAQQQQCGLYGRNAHDLY
jgi:hypothetical protein